MTTKTPPPSWDRRAQELARGLASLDRSKMPPAQFTAAIHSAIVDAMMGVAADVIDRVDVREVRVTANCVRANHVMLQDDEFAILRKLADRLKRLDVEAAAREGGL